MAATVEVAAGIGLAVMVGLGGAVGLPHPATRWLTAIIVATRESEERI